MRFVLLLAVLTLGCQVARAAADVSWMLAYAGKASTDLIADRRLGELVRGGLPADLAAKVLPALGGPPEPVLVTGQRYLSVSSCYPHSCTQKAFLWVDTRTGRVLGAYVEARLVWRPESGSSLVWRHILMLGSQELRGADFPQPAHRALRSWIEDHDLVPEQVTLVSADGARRNLDVAAYAPRPKFHPPEGGPSFDCAQAVSRIDKTICGDAQLATADLQLAALYGDIQRSLSTQPAQDQLQDLQRQWLRHRSSRCAAAADTRTCLGEEYRQQQEVLAVWTPARPAPAPVPAVFSQLQSRIRSELVPPKPDQGIAFAVSDDGRRVFAASWVRPLRGPPSGATLQVFDLSDPGRPQSLAQLPLGDLQVSALHLRGGRLFVVTNVPRPEAPMPESSVVLVDISRLQAPAVLARAPVEDLAIDVAADGSCFAALSTVAPAEEPPGHAVTPEGRIVPGACPRSAPGSGPADARDRAGPDSLVASAGKVFIRSTRGASTAEREVSVAGGHIFGQSFLATADAVLAEVFDTQALTTGLVVLDTGLPPFDPGRLRQVHAALAATAPSAGTPNPFAADEAGARLAAAGAQQALGLSADELRQQQLVSVLADFGRWQAYGNHPGFAIATLQRVLEADPAQTAAWRGLGDAARRALGGNPDAEERLRLTQIALSAYATYQQRGGRIGPDEADFIGFNATHAPAELCQRVSEYHRRGRLAEIAGVPQPVDVDGSGRLLWLDVTYEGSGHFPAVEATDGGGHVLLGTFGQETVYDRAARQVSDIVLVAADGRVYAVFENAEALLSVRDWSGRELCHFP